MLKPLLNFAKQNNIKTAVNPSAKQPGLLGLLPKIDILVLNEEEAKGFGGAKKVFQAAKGIVAVTQGEKGSMVYSQRKVFKAKVKKIKTIERTGAGEAYASGLLAGLLLKDNIEYAIDLARRNAESCIKKAGAKNGLLSRKDL